jgi:hypothetical protein
MCRRRDKFKLDPPAYVEANLVKIRNNSMEEFLGIKPFSRHFKNIFKRLDGKRIPGTDVILRTYDKQISSDTALGVTRNWIDTLDGQHFAAVVHVMDIHDDIISGHPHLMRPSESFKSRHAHGTDNRNQFHQDMALKFFDRNLNIFLESLPNDIRDNTVIAITSDHGAPSFLNEHALSSSTVTGSFHDEYLHIPFLLNGPGVPTRHHKGLGSSIDVAPTICEALGLPADPGFKGRSILNSEKGSDVVFAEHTHRGPCYPLEGPIYQCLRNDSHKYLYKEKLSEHDNSLPETEILIDLVNCPDETRNIGNDPNSEKIIHYFRKIAEHRRSEIKSQALELQGSLTSNRNPRHFK